MCLSASTLIHCNPCKTRGAQVYSRLLLPRIYVVGFRLHLLEEGDKKHVLVTSVRAISPDTHPNGTAVRECIEYGTDLATVIARSCTCSSLQVECRTTSPSTGSLRGQYGQLWTALDKWGLVKGMSRIIWHVIINYELYPVIIMVVLRIFLLAHRWSSMEQH